MSGNTEPLTLSKTGLLGLLLGATGMAAGYQMPSPALQWVGLGLIAAGTAWMVRPAAQAVRA